MKKEMKRSSGILMPIFSLPSNWGIGTLGEAAYSFVDFLAEAGQSWWQMLPVGPTGYGDSPYQSYSSFAGNPYLIDLDLLIRDGLLKEEEVAAYDWGQDPEHVDYGKMFENRRKILHKAYLRGIQKYRGEFGRFYREQEGWLGEYALFMALKEHYGFKAWTEWPDEGIRLHKKDSLDICRFVLRESMEFYAFLQYLFFTQWESLREYARSKGISLIGDIPIYVALDSADVWSDPEWFLLDSDNRPVWVAGVPPDYFTADGQLWGNPLYNWPAMEQNGYSWWVRRMKGAARLFDVIRIDHFRGFEAYWAVPAGATTAKGGQWVEGPGMKVIRVLKEACPEIDFIAEDLGYITEELQAFLEASELPGMKVLEFAFDSREAADYNPDTYPSHSVCYAGTHDNPPLALWKEEADPADIQLALDYLGLESKEGLEWAMLQAGMRSASNLFVAQMQDYLELGAGSRLNQPGKMGGFWSWRMKAGAADGKLAEKIAALTRETGRNPTPRQER
ncbi:MAG: 4-alpha-glucanotransferase [Lachnospiraceae bacterium]|nr:4-alpha-glucanotransferase [Lachnospiraceae bacterium]